MWNTARRSTLYTLPTMLSLSLAAFPPLSLFLFPPTLHLFLWPQRRLNTLGQRPIIVFRFKLIRHLLHDAELLCFASALKGLGVEGFGSGVYG